MASREGVERALERRIATARSFVVACATPLAVAAAIALARNANAPAAFMIGALLVGAGIVLFGPVRGIGGDYAPAVAMLGAAAPAVVVAAQARRATEHTLEVVFGSGLDDLEPEVALPWSALVAFVVATTAWLFVRWVAPRVVARLLRGTALTFFAACAAATVFGAARAVLLPTAPAYVGTLPVIADLAPLTPTDARWCESTSGYRSLVPIVPDEERAFDGVATRRRCTISGCTIALAIGARPPRELGISAGDRVVLRRDGLHGRLVFERGAGEMRSRLWLDGATGALADPSVDPLAIGPPVRWIAGGAIALAAAAMMLFWRRSSRAQLAGARDGLSDGLRVTFDDGTPCFQPGLRIAAGPVLVVPRRAPSIPSYREMGAIHDGIVIAGSRAGAVRWDDVTCATRSAFAIAALAIACAPLFAG